jgi:hypothetical protein
LYRALTLRFLDGLSFTFQATFGGELFDRLKPERF